MAFTSGVVQVGPTATKVYEPTAAGYVVLQSFGTVPVQVGGPGVSFNPLGANASGGGIQLAVGAASGPGAAGQPPTAFSVAHYGSLADPEDAVFCVSQSGTVPVAFVAST